MDEIKTLGQIIPYAIKLSARARALRVSVYHDQRVVVTVPLGQDMLKAEEFIKQKSAWILRSLNYFEKFKGKILIKPSKREYQKLREQAQELAQAKVGEWSRFYNFTYHRIAIKNSKSRWGSCSKKGNLNFNYKIVLLPSRISDYIIVHELCHLGEFNHSRNFWNLVARTIPDHQKLRKELRYNHVRFY